MCSGGRIWRTAPWPGRCRNDVQGAKEGKGAVKRFLKVWLTLVAFHPAIASAEWQLGDLYSDEVLRHWPGPADFANDQAWQDYRQTQATHPLTAQRLLTIADDLRRSPHEFTPEEQDQQAAVERIHYIADQFRNIGTTLEDPNIHRLVVLAGVATDLRPLRSHQRALASAEPGELCSGNHPTPFDGEYTGLYTRYLSNGEKEWLGARMRLRRDHNRVVGRFSFGLGEGTLEGYLMQGKRLVYDWRWGNATGRGDLVASGSGGLRGNWGHENDAKGGGNWDLRVESGQ